MNTMKRAIKFRGFTTDLEYNVWNYGFLVGNYIVEHFFENSGLTLGNRVNLETVGQFTGLYDVDGNEIYEGDILSYDFVEKVCDLKYHHKGESVVAYFEGVGGFIFYDEDNEDYDFNHLSRIEISKQNLRVVGNVFQNRKIKVKKTNKLINYYAK